MITRLYIDGAFGAPSEGRSFAAIDTATERAFLQIAAGQAEAVDHAVKAARAAFDDGRWSGLSVPERAAVLWRIASGIRARLSGIAAQERRDNGKPLPEAEWDIEDAAFCFDNHADWGWHLPSGAVPV